MPWASFNRLKLRIGLNDALSASHPGPCDDDVKVLREFKPYIARQLAALDPDTVRDELREYGAWDDDQLRDDDENLSRILWIACGNIAESKHN